MSLSRHPKGSVRELISLSLPLMISSLSLLMMFFVDRILVAHYSIEAFNATINASTLGWAFTFGGLTIASIAEVFVAQYNGSHQYRRLGEPVWQMIWFGILSSLFFVPLSLFGPEIFYGNGDTRLLEKDYFTWMVFFSPSYAIYGALAAFFIGQGKTIYVSLLALTTNFVNLFLDMVLIFGIEGWMPALGVKGAAIGTSLSSIFQMVCLFIVFIKRENRIQFGTSNWKLKWKPFFQCLRIGVPGGCSGMVEIWGWAAFYEMMTFVGPDYITVGGVFESCLILLLFVPEGLNKGVIAISGNLIGARQRPLIPKVVKSGFTLTAIFFAALTIGYPFYVDPLIELFLNQPLIELAEPLVDTLRSTILLTIIYIFFDSMRFVIAGVLTAAGDTVFLLIANFGTVWLFLVIPTYFLMVRGEASILQSIAIAVAFAVATMLTFFTRYIQGRWQKMEIL